MSVAAVIPVKDEDFAEVNALAGYLAEHMGVYVVDDSDPLIPVYYGWGLEGAGSLGGSIELGLLEAWSDGFDRVLVIDAGGSHSAIDGIRLLAHDADVVIGSRFVAGGRHEGPWWRRFTSRWYARLCTIITGCGIRDWTSGMRVYSRRAIEAILDDEPWPARHAWQAAALAAACRASCSIKEVPITYRVIGQSTFSGEAAGEALRLLREGLR